MVTPNSAKINEYANAAQFVHDDWIKNTPNGQAVYDAALKILRGLR